MDGSVTIYINCVYTKINSKSYAKAVLSVFFVESGEETKQSSMPWFVLSHLVIR